MLGGQFANNGFLWHSVELLQRNYRTCRYRPGLDRCCSRVPDLDLLGEAKPGGLQTGGFPTFFAPVRYPPFDYSDSVAFFE